VSNSSAQLVQRATRAFACAGCFAILTANARLGQKALSERDICTKFISPAITAAKWDVMYQIREEVAFTKGRVIVRGEISTRGEPKRAGYILSYQPGIPLAVIEAKDNNRSVGAGMQQALDYGETLDVPFVFGSNGDAFVFHDRTGQTQPVESEISFADFPSPEELWQRYCKWKNITLQQEPVVAKIITSKALTKNRATISKSPSTAPLKPARAAPTGCSWSFNTRSSLECIAPPGPGGIALKKKRAMADALVRVFDTSPAATPDLLFHRQPSPVLRTSSPALEGLTSSGLRPPSPHLMRRRESRRRRSFSSDSCSGLYGPSTGTPR